MGRENISPKAIGLLSSHFDGFACLDIEEIHTGSRSGTLTGSRSGTLNGSMIGVGAGVSSGTRTRRLSGSPLSAIELSRVVIGHNVYLALIRMVVGCPISLMPIPLARCSS